MKYVYAYIFGCVAIVIAGVFMMYYFSVYQSYSDITPQFGQVNPRQYVDEHKARELAESSIGELRMIFYGYRFGGVVYDWGYDPNGTKKLEDVRLFYQSPNPSVAELVVTEDPQLSKVINATVMTPTRFGT